MDLLECLTKTPNKREMHCIKPGGQEGFKKRSPLGPFSLASVHPGPAGKQASSHKHSGRMRGWDRGALQQREALKDSVRMRKHERLNTSVIVARERPLSQTDNGQGSCCSKFTGFEGCTSNKCSSNRLLLVQLIILCSFSSYYLSLNRYQTMSRFSVDFCMCSKIIITAATDEHCSCSCHSLRFSIDGNANLNGAKPSCTLPSQKLPAL